MSTAAGDLSANASNTSPSIHPRGPWAAMKSCWPATRGCPSICPCRRDSQQWAIRARRLESTCSWKAGGATSQDVEEILAACRRNGVQFMDGVMFMHSRRMESIRERLADGQSIGALKRITSQFSFGATSEFFTSNIRADGRLEPLGCLGDLGWYNIRFILWAMNWELPARVTGRILAEHRRPDSSTAVPTDFSAELFFAGGVSAAFYCSFWRRFSSGRTWRAQGDTVRARLRASLAWQRGRLCGVESTHTITGCDFNLEEHSRRFAVCEDSNSTENSQEANMFAGLPNWRLRATGWFVGRNVAENTASSRCLVAVFANRETPRMFFQIECRNP